MTGVKFLVMQTKAGWVVQNASTYSIIACYSSQAQAQQVANKLNGKA